jgi:DnaK suppressor protein
MMPPPAGSAASHLTPDELAEFCDLLLSKRREILGEAVSLRNEVARANAEDQGGRLSSLPTHAAELASDTWEQELAADLFQNCRTLLKEIDDALERIESHTYGICAATGRPIPKTRLRAIPWARYCIEYAKANEAGR